MLGNIGCFFLDFHHRDGVLGSLKTIKNRRTRGGLITEYQNQIPGFFSYPLPIGVPAFQDCEIHVEC
jgi:hypothetical protein